MIGGIGTLNMSTYLQEMMAVDKSENNESSTDKVLNSLSSSGDTVSISAEALARLADTNTNSFDQNTEEEDSEAEAENLAGTAVGGGGGGGSSSSGSDQVSQIKKQIADVQNQIMTLSQGGQADAAKEAQLGSLHAQLSSLQAALAELEQASEG